MRKLTLILLGILLMTMLAIPALGASDGPRITMQPQSPNYPHYSVAIYTVKAEGANMKATWYMDWQEKTYTISNLGGAMQAWEPFAGEAYGTRQLDDNTFAFVFEGIEQDLDGAWIWCVIKDADNEVTSQKVRVSVGNENSPPVIVDIPAQLTVEQGAQAEIRCVAQSPDEETQLTFLWYETDTGKLEDIRAVDRGTQTSDFLLCDTSVVGTRNYICQVSTSAGGMAYSSVVPVTVTEKTTEPTTVPTTIPETTEATTPGTEAETKPEESAPAVTQPKEDGTPQNEEGLPWWSLILIGLAGAGIGVVAAVLLVRKEKKQA